MSALSDHVQSAQSRDIACDLVRRASAIKQDALADILMVDRSAVSRALSGKSRLTVEQFARLIVALGLQLTETQTDAVTVSADLHQSMEKLLHHYLGSALGGEDRNA